MHIYDFITDEIQYGLKNRAIQETRSGRFEEVLKKYKTIFLGEFDKLNISDDVQNLSNHLKDEKQVTDWFECFLKVVSADIKAIDKIFDEVLKSYNLFNRSKHYLSVLKMHDLLEYFDLLRPAHFSKIGAFYRGRPIKYKDNTWRVDEGIDCRDRRPYFHIPFNLRRVLGNQRFSFSGIPILYIGSSVMTVYYELRETDLNSKKVGISQYGCNQLVQYDINRELYNVKEKDNFFDITNDIFDLVNDVFYRLIEGKIKISACDDKGSYPGKAELIISFRRLILSHLCTFPRINNSAFSEEYVIPQILTEAVKIHKFDGILFPSTQFGSEKKIEIRSDWKYHTFKYNLAIFTEYSEIFDYDNSILDNFYLTVLDLNNYNSTDFKTLKTTIEEDLKECTKRLTGRVDGYHNKRTTLIIEHIYKKIRLYEALFIDDQNYLETFAGKVELLYLRKYIDLSLGKALQHIPPKDSGTETLF